jgi:serine/threonine protein kinase
VIHGFGVAVCADRHDSKALRTLYFSKYTIHRDISCGNILIRPRNGDGNETSAYLVDLENAKFTPAKKPCFLSAIQLSERDRERAIWNMKNQKEDRDLTIDPELTPVFANHRCSELIEQIQALNLYDSQTSKKVKEPCCFLFCCH